MIDDVLDGEQQAASSKPMLQDYKKFKQSKDVPQEAEIQYLKQNILAQALVHHKHVMLMPHHLLDPNPTNTIDFIMMASRAYSTKNTWYIEYEVTGPPKQKLKYAGEILALLRLEKRKFFKQQQNRTQYLKAIPTRRRRGNDLSFCKRDESL
jgi:hypothetical protein